MLHRRWGMSPMTRCPKCALPARGARWLSPLLLALVAVLVLAVAGGARAAEEPGTYERVLRATGDQLHMSAELRRVGTAQDDVYTLLLAGRTQEDQHFGLRCTVYRDILTKERSQRMAEAFSGGATTGLGAAVPVRAELSQSIEGVAVRALDRPAFVMQSPVGQAAVPRQREIQVRVTPLVTFSVVGSGRADPALYAAALIQQLRRAELVAPAVPPGGEPTRYPSNEESPQGEAGQGLTRVHPAGTPYWLFLLGGLLLLGAVGARVRPLRNLFLAALVAPLIALTIVALGQVALTGSDVQAREYFPFSISPWTAWQMGEQWLPGAAWLAAGVVGGLIAAGPLVGMIAGVLIPLLPWVLIKGPRFEDLPLDPSTIGQVARDLTAGAPEDLLTLTALCVFGGLIGGLLMPRRRRGRTGQTDPQRR